MPLRDYQNELLTNAVTRYDGGRGLCKPFVVMATGLGKGEVIAHLPIYFELGEGWLKGKKMLVFVHRDTLLKDLAERIAFYNPGLKVGIDQGENVADLDCDVVCASVQTIGTNYYNRSKPDAPPMLDLGFMFADELPDTPEGFSNKRLERWNPDDFAIVVVDEAHHAAAETYRNVLRYFRVYKPEPEYNSNRLLMAFSATPSRADNLGLDGIFDEILRNKAGDLDILFGIKSGYLCNIEPEQVYTDVSLDDVSTRAGDFATKQLEKAVNTPSRNRLVVNDYLTCGSGLPGLAFTVDVQHSEDLAAAFIEGGVRAAAVSYRTPKAEQKRIIEAYKNFEIQVLVSSSLLLEGFDAPHSTVIMWCRPTKSRTVLVQGIGRGLRPYPKPEDVARFKASGITPPYIKKNCIFRDYVDTCKRHSLVGVNSLFGLPPKMRLDKPVLETVEEVQQLTLAKPGMKLDGLLSMQDLRSMATKIDLFTVPEIPAEVKKSSSYSWMRTGPGVYSLSLAQSPSGPDALMIQENALGQFDVFSSRNGVRQALKFMDTQVPADQRGLVRLTAAWRGGEATDKQIREYARLYPERRKQFNSPEDFIAAVRKQFSKGDVSRLIGARRAARR